jgi:hypothetical protein
MMGWCKRAHLTQKAGVYRPGGALTGGAEEARNALTSRFREGGSPYPIKDTDFQNQIQKLTLPGIRQSLFASRLLL